MKSLTGILTLTIIFLMACCSVTPAFAQGFTTNAEVSWGEDDNGQVFRFVATIDSLNTYTSKAFYLSEYDGESLFSYPVAYGKVASSVVGVPKIKSIIQGTYGDGNWFNVDTLSTSDSVETYNTGTVDLNNRKCLAYRIEISGVTTNPGDTIYTLSLYAYRREDKAR
jgi:hypothetical protein